MADADAEAVPGQVTQAEANGPLNGLDDEERAKMRPPDIDADVREMERRKRVDMIMNSKVFREELERIIEQQLREGGGPTGLLQQLSEMMGGPTLRGGGGGGSTTSARSCVIPINDVRGAEGLGPYVKGERLQRCKLAAAYRLVDLHGWSQGVYNHLTLRLRGSDEHFLINPFGLLYHEITAGCLVKLDMQGNVVESGITNLGVNLAGWALHSAVHAARPDVRCVMHVHTPAAVAVSACKEGLLMLCQEAALLGPIAYHDYGGIVTGGEEREQVARDLGPMSKVLFLRNHGLIVCGESVEEAFQKLFNAMIACETQVRALSCCGGIENLVMIPPEVCARTYEMSCKGAGGVDSKQEGLPAGSEEEQQPKEPVRKTRSWRPGELEWEARMRMLDDAGFRTGHVYRLPTVRGETPRVKYDVEVPPAVSSLGYLLEEEELYKQGPWRKYDGRKIHERSRWLNSPNVYQKVEVLETGTPDPKKITKWVAEGSPTHSSAVRIETPLQFVPKNTDPKEFKRLQQQIKENRRAGGVSAGPQSHVLEGVSWEEVKRMQDAGMSGTGDQVVIVGAASKGIIQRDFQHHAMVYKTPYAKNPFDSITDEEIEEYRRIVEKRQQGGDSASARKKPPPRPRPPLPPKPRRIAEEEEPTLSQPLDMGSPVDGTTTDATKSPPMSPSAPRISDTEEESREDQVRVLKVEAKHVPRPIQAEVVHSDETDMPVPYVERSKSARLPSSSDSESRKSPFLRSWSLGRKKAPPPLRGDAALNGEDPDTQQSTFSQSSSKEGSPTKDASSTSESSKKEKKKRKGLKTPSFLKKKKEKKKQADG